MIMMTIINETLYEYLQWKILVDTQVFISCPMSISLQIIIEY